MTTNIAAIKLAYAAAQGSFAMTIPALISQFPCLFILSTFAPKQPKAAAH